MICLSTVWFRFEFVKVPADLNLVQLTIFFFTICFGSDEIESSVFEDWLESVNEDKGHYFSTTPTFYVTFLDCLHIFRICLPT